MCQVCGRRENLKTFSRGPDNPISVNNRHTLTHAEKEAFEEKRSQGFKLFKDRDVKDKNFAETKFKPEEKEDVVFFRWW